LSPTEGGLVSVTKAVTGNVDDIALAELSLFILTAYYDFC